MRILSRQQRPTHSRSGALRFGLCAPVLAVHTRRQDGFGVRSEAGLFDVRIASGRGFRASAISRRPDGPLVRAARSFPNMQGVIDLRGRSAGGSSSLQPAGRHLFIGPRVIAGCRPYLLSASHQFACQGADAAPVGLHASPPSYGSNRSRRSRAWRSQKQISRYIE